MRILYTIIIVLLMLFIITFSLENTLPIQLKYYTFIDVTLQVYMIIFLSFLAGVVFTGFMGIVERFRLNRTISRLNKTIKELRRELRDSQKNQFVEEPELMAGSE
jgi:uncharacterized integral membrane protein